MRIVLLGAPGSGKGTQARILAERYEVPHVSTGDLLRDAVAAGTEIGRQARAIMDAGELVPDSLVLTLLEERLREKDARNGFVLDGFPRNIPQAQELDNRLGHMGRNLQIALHIAVDPEDLVKRLTGRLTCGGCGAIYNVHFSPPKKKGVCDQCGARDLRHRSDDNETTIRTRLATYQESTEPLIAYYKAQHKLRTIQGVGEVEEIARRISDVVDLEIRPLAVTAIENRPLVHPATGTSPAGSRPMTLESAAGERRTVGPAGSAPPAGAATARAGQAAKKATRASAVQRQKPALAAEAAGAAKKAGAAPAKETPAKASPAGSSATTRKPTAAGTAGKVARSATGRKAPAAKTAKKITKKKIAKKKVSKKTAAKKVTRKKVATRKVTGKPAKKLAKKAAKKVARKVAKKAVTRKAAATATRKKPARRKTAPRKAAARKSTTRKAATRKLAGGAARKAAKAASGARRSASKSAAAVRKVVRRAGAVAKKVARKAVARKKTAARRKTSVRRK